MNKLLQTQEKYKDQFLKEAISYNESLIKNKVKIDIELMQKLVKWIGETDIKTETGYIIFARRVFIFDYICSAYEKILEQN